MNFPKTLTGIFLISLIAFSCQQDDELPDSEINQQDCITTASASNGQPIEGEYIAIEEDQTGSSESIEKLLPAGKIKRKLPGSSEGRSYFQLRLKPDEAARLKERKVKIEPDRVISACGCFSVVAPGTITWNIEQVGYGDGRGKTAWVIDSGVDSDHPDLNTDLSRSKSFMSDNSSIEDENGHGTHIAGIIGALNNEIGTLGVASGANIVALKVLDKNGEGKLSSMLNALAYIRSNAKAGDVVNISIAFPQTSEILENEIKSIASLGIYFSLAAGNETADIDAYSPARTSGSNIYTVSAVDSLRRIAKFSNYGDGVDFAAPGVSVTSTYKDGNYAVLNGTSMAAPHVAGILLINNGQINTNGVATSDPDGSPDPLAHR